MCFEPDDPGANIVWKQFAKNAVAHTAELSAVEKMINAGAIRKDRGVWIIEQRGHMVSVQVRQQNRIDLGRRAWERVRLQARLENLGVERER
jgi:hypothetical protein